MKKTSNLGILSILLGCSVAIIGVIILKRSVITHIGQHEVFVCRENENGSLYFGLDYHFSLPDADIRTLCGQTVNPFLFS